MTMADAPDPITSPPSTPGTPYDATAPDGSMVGPWVKLNSGPCDMNGAVTGDWPSSGGWQQT